VGLGIVAAASRGDGCAVWRAKLLKLAWPRFSLSCAWLSVPVFLSFVALSLALLREGDLFWYLQLGEAIVTTRRLPAVDEWTAAGEGRAFNAAYSWLGDVILYQLADRGGLAALVAPDTGGHGDPASIDARRCEFRASEVRNVYPA